MLIHLGLGNILNKSQFFFLVTSNKPIILNTAMIFLGVSPKDWLHNLQKYGFYDLNVSNSAFDLNIGSKHGIRIGKVQLQFKIIILSHFRRIQKKKYIYIFFYCSLYQGHAVPLSSAWNLMQDFEFHIHQQRFKEIVKQIRWSCTDRTSHFPPISEDYKILMWPAALDPGNTKKVY